MTLKDICTSFELSKRLAEAGVPQEDGIAYWIETDEGWKFLETSHLRKLYPDSIRAFTFNELWKMLPTQIHDNDELKIYQLECHKSSVDESFTLGYNNIAIGEENILVLFNKDTPQEAAGELLLWCIEQGYVSPKEK